jgi:hypothetical protein
VVDGILDVDGDGDAGSRSEAVTPVGSSDLSQLHPSPGISPGERKKMRQSHHHAQSPGAVYIGDDDLRYTAADRGTQLPTPSAAVDDNASRAVGAAPFFLVVRNLAAVPFHAVSRCLC